MRTNAQNGHIITLKYDVHYSYARMRKRVSPVRSTNQKQLDFEFEQKAIILINNNNNKNRIRKRGHTLPVHLEIRDLSNEQKSSNEQNLTQISRTNLHIQLSKLIYGIRPKQKSASAHRTDYKKSNKK